MDEIDFSEDFSDIVAKDSRYDARAYSLLMDVVRYLSETQKRHSSSAEILDEFKDRTLDQYGPLAHTVLTEWGVTCTEDIGEMMFNLVEGKRVGKSEDDTPEDFRGGYNFEETFLGPYQV